jgi:hypothetical protein
MQQLDDPIARNNMIMVVILSSLSYRLRHPASRKRFQNFTEGTGLSGLRDLSTSARDAVRSRGATLTWT